MLLPTILVVQDSNQSTVCVCARLCPVVVINFELKDLRPKYLTRWFTLTISRSCSKINVTELLVRPRVRIF